MSVVMYLSIIRYFKNVKLLFYAHCYFVHLANKKKLFQASLNAIGETITEPERNDMNEQLLIRQIDK